MSEDTPPTHTRKHGPLFSIGWHTVWGNLLSLQLETCLAKVEKQCQVEVMAAGYQSNNIALHAKHTSGPCSVSGCLRVSGSHWHDDVIKWKYFPRYLPSCGEFTGHRWIHRTKASDAELWYFLWFASEPTVEQTMEMLLVWDAIALIMTSL